MKNKLNAFLVIQAILILILVWLLTYFGRDEFNNIKPNTDNSKNTQSLLKTANGVSYITLSSEIQSNSGIKIQPVQSSAYIKKMI